MIASSGEAVIEFTIFVILFSCEDATGVSFSDMTLLAKASDTEPADDRKEVVNDVDVLVVDISESARLGGNVVEKALESLRRLSVPAFAGSDF